jgi:hypothetical protein
MVKVEVVGISIWWGFGLVDIELDAFSFVIWAWLEPRNSLTGR